MTFLTLNKHLSRRALLSDDSSCSMLNPVEQEILNAQKYKKYQEIQLFLGSDKPRMPFFLLISVKMPTVVGILAFMSRKNFMLS